MKTVTINVTQEHIDAGKIDRACGGFCPLELAARDAGYPDATVGSEFWWPSPTSSTFDLPEDARAFVRTFDECGDVEPATFELPLE